MRVYTGYAGAIFNYFDPAADSTASGNPWKACEEGWKHKIYRKLRRGTPDTYTSGLSLVTTLGHTLPRDMNQNVQIYI